MATAKTNKRFVSRNTAYCFLFAAALLLSACLFWFAVRAMADANPWFSAIGLVTAVLYVGISLANKNPLRSQTPPPLDQNDRPRLRLVKK